MGFESQFDLKSADGHNVGTTVGIRRDYSGPDRIKRVVWKSLKSKRIAPNSLCVGELAKTGLWYPCLSANYFFCNRWLIKRLQDCETKKAPRNRGAFSCFDGLSKSLFLPFNLHHFSPFLDPFSPAVSGGSSWLSPDDCDSIFMGGNCSKALRWSSVVRWV